MEKQIFDYIICGGGASGLLLLDALSGDSYFNTPSILLIEQEVKNSNDRTWCFWEKGTGKWDSLVKHQWQYGSFKTSDVDLFLLKVHFLLAFRNLNKKDLHFLSKPCH